MKQKLLKFSKNLIIALGLVVIVMILFFTTSSSAVVQPSTESFGKLMRQTIGDWYRWIRRISLTIYGVGFLVIILKLLADRTPDKLALVKKSIGRFVMMFFVIYFLNTIMIMIMNLNAEGINLARTVGTNFSGIDMASDEYDLYETALSKAYEIAAVPGFIGLLMYLLLVYYTYKFVIVYAKRYINIIVLILLAPIIFVVSTLQTIITGVNDGRIGKWFKEFIFNVVIQTLHAIFYALLIGLALKWSDDNENVIGVLIALIFFGFIFKLDGIIRKLFNFVGGSTNINTSKTANTLINATGGAINAGLGAASGKIASGSIKFGEDLNKASDIYKSHQTAEGKLKFKDFMAGTGEVMDKVNNRIDNRLDKMADNLDKKLDNLPEDVKKLPGQAKDKAMELGKQGLDFAGEKLQGVGQSIASAYAVAKADVKDAKNILNGERVKANLTAEEVVEAQHIMEEGEGLEGIRQNIQSAGASALAAVGSIGKAKKNIDAQFLKAYKFANGRVKYGLKEMQKEFHRDVRRLELENEVELIKRLPRIMKKYAQEQQLIKVSRANVELDTTSAMMIAIDVNFDSRLLLDTIKQEYTQGNPILYSAFEKLGTQIALSPTVGSVRIGMGLLAEERQEEIQEHRIEEIATGRVREKRTIRRFVSTVQGSVTREHTRTSADGDEVEAERKVYTFSRFSEASAAKITSRIKRNYRQNNKYLATLTRTQSAFQVESLRVRGRASTQTMEVDHTIRASRTDRVKSVRQIKLAQQAAVTQYREFERNATKVETAHAVASQIMTAKNTIRLGFKAIDNMTPGEVGLQRMVQEGRATELPSGLIAMKQAVPLEEKLKATGLVQQSAEEGQPKTVLQFVMTEEGKIVPQIVTVEGQIVKPALTENGELAVHSIINQMMKPNEEGKPLIVQIMEKQAAGEQVVLQQQEGESDEQFALRQAITTAFVEYVQAMPEETRSQVQTLENETPEQAIFRQFVTETISQYIVEQPAQSVVTIANNEAMAQNIITQMMQPDETGTPLIMQIIEQQAAGEPIVLEQQAGETDEQFAIRQVITTAFVEYIQTMPEEARSQIQTLENETPEQAIFRQFIAESQETGLLQTILQQPEVTTQQVVLEQKENETDAQFAFRQFVTQAIIETIKTSAPVEQVQETSAQVEQVQETSQQTEFKQMLVQAYTQYVEEIKQEQGDKVEGKTQEEIQQEFVQHIIETFVQTTSPEEPARPQITSSEEGIKQLEQVVQHIVTLDGTIVEQVVNADNTIEAESYQVVEQASDVLMSQIQEITANENIVSNRDLGISEDATSTERVQALERLMDNITASSQAQELLQDILAAPVEEESTEIPAEEYVRVMEEYNIHSKEELKQVMYMDAETPDGAIPGESPAEELARKQEIVQSLIERNSVTSMPSGPQYGGEEDDSMEDAIAHLTEEVSSLTSSNNDTLFDTAAEMERVRIAEDLMSSGDFTVETPPTDADIDARVSNLSDLLVDLAKDTMKEAAKTAVRNAAETILEYPTSVISDTISDFEKAEENYQKLAKTPEEIAAEKEMAKAEKEWAKEVAKAEKKWAKEHGQEADEKMAEKIAKQDKEQEEKKKKKEQEKRKGKSSSDSDSQSSQSGEDDTNESDAAVKITLKFFGGVSAQGQSVTLSNHHSFKDFYDKAHKLDTADMNKTLERFIQTYGDKLSDMLLMPFDFSKNPVKDMDGWGIYVVTKAEDVSQGEKEKPAEPVAAPEDQVIDASLVGLLELYFMDIRRVFVNFVEEHEIESFDEIYENNEERLELVRRFRMLFFRKGERNEQQKAIELTENLYKDARFKEILREINQEKIAKDAVKGAKARVKVTTKKKAEEAATARVSREAVDEFRQRQKASLVDQILDSVMTAQEEAAAASPDIANLLNQLNESRVFIRTPDGDNNTQNRLRLEYQTKEEEMP